MTEKKETKVHVTIKTQELYAAMNACIIHMSEDSSRPHLNGVHFDFNSEGDEKCYLVATDGHRMAKYEIRVTFCKDSAYSANSCQVTLQAGSAKLLFEQLKTEIKLDKQLHRTDITEVDIKFDPKKHTACFTFTSKAELSGSLHDGSYPPWRQIMPGKRSTPAPEDRATEIGLNAFYLADCTKAFGMKGRKAAGSSNSILHIKLKSALDPVQIISPAMPELTIVIMPMRI